MEDSPTTRSGAVDYRLRPDGVDVVGWSCPADGYSSAVVAFACPLCGERMVDAMFDGLGTVWSFTTILVPSPSRPDPYTLAYVDVDNGPRLVVDVSEAEAPNLRVDARVELYIDKNGRASAAVAPRGAHE